MTNEQVILVCRRAMEEVDTSTSTITDPEIFAAVSDERDLLEIEQVPNASTFAVGYDQSDAITFGVQPEADLPLDLGTVLALRAAATLLRRQYRELVRRGSIGYSWQSGLESESTLQAGKDYQVLIKHIDEQAERLLIIMRRDEAGFRIQ